MIRNVKRNTPIHYRQDGELIIGNILASQEMKEHDPFLFMEDVIFPEGTFGLHPHRGIETITYVIEGEVLHYDTTHGSGAIRTGDVQWMTAGKGVLHAEEPAPQTKAHVLQLWLNLPATHKMMPSHYQTLLRTDTPTVRRDGATVHVFSGRLDHVTSTTTNVVPVNMYDIEIDKHATFSFTIEHGDKAFFVLIDGEVKIGNETIATSSPAVIHLEHEGTDVIVHATMDSHLLFYSGPLLREPIAARGPFVMNTKEELEQAFADYRAGRFHD